MSRIGFDNLCIFNKQEVFNHIIIHLLSQRVQSLDPETGDLRYRSSNGLKCPVGYLMGADVYDPEFEGQSVNEVYKAIGMEPTGVYHKELIRDLQLIHDEGEPHNWHMMLIELAAEYELDARLVQQFDPIVEIPEYD